MIKHEALIPIKGGSYTAVIHPNRGANCISLRHKTGAILLREPEDPLCPDHPHLYGMPLLFPANRISGGTFEFEGRTYRFPINEPQTGCHLHGELHAMPFQILGRTESTLQCRYTATREKPYLTFPHEFEIDVEYALTEDGLHHTVTIRNLSRENMPVFLGFHTTFQTLFSPHGRPEDIRLHVGIVEEYERNMEVNYLPTGVKPPFDAVSSAIAEGTYLPFSGKVSRHYRGKGNMTLTDTTQRLRLVYETDEKYAFRLIYNGGEDGFICLEPQTCLANCANSPFPREEAGFVVIGIGESKTYRSKIYMEKF